jgi:hypothetical protein
MGRGKSYQAKPADTSEGNIPSFSEHIWSISSLKPGVKSAERMEQSLSETAWPAFLYSVPPPTDFPTLTASRIALEPSRCNVDTEVKIDNASFHAVAYIEYGVPASSDDIRLVLLKRPFGMQSPTSRTLNIGHQL